jgi:hypothetical protein
MLRKTETPDKGLVEDFRYLRANITMLSEADRAFVQAIQVPAESDRQRLASLVEDIQCRQAW